MKKVIIVSLFLIVNCKNEKNAEQNNVNIDQPSVKEIITKESNDDEEAQSWLKNAIVRYFKADISDQENIMKNSTTKAYYECKTDATNVDMDVEGSLSLKEFDQKWGSKYDKDSIGIHTGFLISGQDWTNIEVQECEVMTASKNQYMFKVVLADDGFKAKYFRNIKVIKEKGNFLIDNIVELN